MLLKDRLRAWRLRQDASWMWEGEGEEGHAAHTGIAGSVNIAARLRQDVMVTNRCHEPTPRTHLLDVHCDVDPACKPRCHPPCGIARAVQGRV